MAPWILAAALLLTSAGQLAAQGKGIRFWNLTTATVSGFQLSPAGKDNWGPNLALNDKDGEVDHDERRGPWIELELVRLGAHPRHGRSPRSGLVNGISARRDAGAGPGRGGGRQQVLKRCGQQCGVVHHPTVPHLGSKCELTRLVA